METSQGAQDNDVVEVWKSRYAALQVFSAPASAALVAVSTFGFPETGAAMPPPVPPAPLSTVFTGAGRGNTALLAKQPDRAIACYSRALSMDSGRAEVYANRCAAYSELGLWEEAVRDADEVRAASGAAAVPRRVESRHVAKTLLDTSPCAGPQASAQQREVAVPQSGGAGHAAVYRRGAARCGAGARADSLPAALWRSRGSTKRNFTSAKVI